MSLGGPGHQESMHDAVVGAAALGVRFSLAAGNESADAEDFEPAHIEADNVFTISAIDSNDGFASFSNWGEPVDFAAPGVAILSTRLGGGTTTMSGTSMAAPHVCGILLHMAPPNMDGYAIDDPDGDPDPIAHF
jgi:subtilisin family serine protease